MDKGENGQLTYATKNHNHPSSFRFLLFSCLHYSQRMFSLFHKAASTLAFLTEFLLIDSKVWEQKQEASQETGNVILSYLEPFPLDA